MATGRLYINDKDAYATWSAGLEDGSEAKLLTPSGNKEYAENNFRSQHGKQTFRSNPRKADRDITLIFYIASKSKEDFLSKYQSLVNELDKGLVNLRVPSLKTTYKLDTTGYQELNFIQSLGKIAVRFNESNPKDRVII